MFVRQNAKSEIKKRASSLFPAEANTQGGCAFQVDAACDSAQKDIELNRR